MCLKLKIIQSVKYCHTFLCPPTVYIFFVLICMRGIYIGHITSSSDNLHRGLLVLGTRQARLTELKVGRHLLLLRNLQLCN